MRSIFYTGPPPKEVADLFRVRMILDGRSWTVDSHLIGSELRIVPYDNGDSASDATGEPFGRGDSAVAELFPLGEIGFAVKHHRAAQRVLEVPYRSVFLLREELKLQGSHLQLVVGVERDGAPGAVTLSAPQTYESGRFGTASYPMIFLRPVYPSFLGAEQVRAFRDNLRTMMLGFSSVASFPSSYGSGDPMAASTRESVREHVAMMVRAIGGDAEALQWFKAPERRLYCGELGYLATNAGLLVPLNARTLVPMVGPEAWEAFVDQVERHGRGELSRFSTLNQNRLVPMIEVATAPEDLLPAGEYAQRAGAGDGAQKPEDRLAFEPQTAADLLRVYLRSVLPAMDQAAIAGGGDGGAVDVPALRAELIRSVRAGFVQILELAKRPPVDPARRRVEDLLDQMAVVAAADGSGEEALDELEPLLDELGQHLLTLDPPAGVLLAPPSLFQAVAQDLWPAGLLDLEYVGHGLHVTLVRPAA
ncbi:MAG TPA: hypothetical protein VMT85_16540 [Thermoanaerobaculia bacterium]|nr:hypothetical protein [Thermoanaerobaculia bacterium]